MIKTENKYLKFDIQDNKILLNGFSFVEIGVAGRNRDTHLGAKLVNSSETNSLKYVSCENKDGNFELVLKNDIIEVRADFGVYADTSAFSVFLTVKNITDKKITLENISFKWSLNELSRNADKIRFTRFFQGHHSECQPRTETLFDSGITDSFTGGQNRVYGLNVGSWSTKEALPQGILECPDGNCTMFQIESNNDWYYEIGDDNQKKLYLCLDGGNEAFGGWTKTLNPGDSYTTETFARAFSDKGVDGVIDEMTRYRRHIAACCVADGRLPVIFNEYMHLSWDNPHEDNTRKYADFAAKAGSDYYVIDCGWHDEIDGNIIYPYVGEWRESHKRFPHGVKYTTDYIRSLGMKAGLWIEPEIIGCKCEKMIAYYDDDCFIRRHGERICVMNRYFLDYRNAKVRTYMTETIRRMIEDYGADYIKLDYNQDLGAGTELGADSMADGLKKCCNAYLGWVDEIRRKFKNVIFETCSSGGMRMDYKTLRHFSLVSTSDQIDYKKYPYIVGNVLSAVIPEQAAVWSYPVVGEATREQVIMNMINSFLGRMHLASDLSALSADNFALVQEGVEYYKKICNAKLNCLPVFPIGFTDFSKKTVCAGFKTADTKNKLYIAVWNLGGEKEITLSVGGEYEKINCVYPAKQNEVEYSLNNGALKIKFTEDYQARFFESVNSD